MFGPPIARGSLLWLSENIYFTGRALSVTHSWMFQLPGATRVHWMSIWFCAWLRGVHSRGWVFQQNWGFCSAGGYQWNAILESEWYNPAGGTDPSRRIQQSLITFQVYLFRRIKSSRRDNQLSRSSNVSKRKYLLHWFRNHIYRNLWNWSKVQPAGQCWVALLWKT